MNVYVKNFLHRGLVFSGLGPLVLGIVYAVLQQTVPDFTLSGNQVFWGILSTYLLAFVQAGASVLNQVDHWPLAKSLLCHFSLLYLSYSLCYIANTWIPFEPMVLGIFTAIFVGGYLVIWLTVYLTVRGISKRINRKLSR